MPYKILVALALLVPLAGYVTELLLRKLRMRGYGRIRGEVAAIVNAIHGETDRDSGDLLIRGSMGRLPVLIRFSHSDKRPGLNIQMPAAGSVSLFCVPKGHESDGGRVPLPVANAKFRSRFRLSSNHPAEARVLFCAPETLADIQKLCHTSHCFLVLDDQRLELSELLIPAERLSQRVLECIRGLVSIAAISWQMPGADPERAIQISRRWNWFRTAYIGGPILLLCSMLLFAKLQRPSEVPQTLPLPSGVVGEEASQIPDVRRWRLAQPGDFDVDAVAWLQQRGQQAHGSIRGAFAGAGREDSAYVLKRVDGSAGDPSRLVVFLNGQIRFDVNMPEIALAARVPKDRISSIDWLGRGPVGQPDGDGLLVIQRYQDSSSAIVLFASGVQLLTGHPKDFHSVSFQ